MFEMINL